MTIWRWVVGVGLACIVGLPLTVPLVGLRAAAAGPWETADVVRVIHLTGNTLLLVGGALLLAMPAGIFLALALFRGAFPCRHVCLGLLLLMLFVPVPVLVSSWQSLLGHGGAWPSRLWQADGRQAPDGPDRPWATGWGPALWVQGVAALPWIVFVVGLGLAWSPTAVEELALQRLSRFQTICLVTLPHSRAALGAAALLAAMFTANDVSVSGMMQIATFAEEFDTQFTLGHEDALARITLLTLPLVLVLWGLLALATARLERVLPPLSAPGRETPRLMELTPGFGLLLFVALVALTCLPLGGLVWNLGQAGRPPTWSLAHLAGPLADDARLYGGQIVATLGIALLTGGLVAILALVCCWLALDSAWMRFYLVSLLTLAWLLPGPVVGIALKQAILTLVQVWSEGPVTDLLYRGPSPLPVMWAHFIRFLPVAVFFLWPVVRLVAPELRDAARLEGARPLNELIHLIWPLTRGAVLVTALASAALCLGEVGAGGRVETPNWEPFAKLILDRMHYGIDRNVASLCVLLLAALVALGLAASLWRARPARAPEARG